MNPLGQQPGPLRVRVPLGRLADWVARLPLLPLPAPFARLAALGAADGDLPPPLVAGSLATHGLAEVSAELHYSGGGERVVACVAMLGELAATLVRRAGSLGEVAEVGLLPAQLAGRELLQWLPASPMDPGARAGLAVAVVDAGPVRCWLEHLHAGPSGWCRQAPDGTPEPIAWDRLRADLEFLLLERRVRCETDASPDAGRAGGGHP